ncbi:UbiE family methyltransferase [Athelia psychrophila]|uniref:UbiE family methyltransferase n=1 Tax=Athelia psychrophila TaxID=1759441 RepID=A0A166WVF7_9AGAM|nr:UbiE family methyltransferase [Fibularhizoctonia sp. CBS 109695]
MSQETATYTSGHHESVLRSHIWRTAANSAAYLLPHLQPHMKILDVGCGPGTITADLAALVPQGHVTGLEYEPGVLDQARAHAAARGLANIDFAQGDVNALRYPDGTFDVVHAHQVLQHVGDPVRALREMRRVAKNGGIVAVRESDFAAMTWYPAVEGMDAWHETYMRVARANGGEPDAGRRLHAWAHEAGFAWPSITVTAGTWCFQTPADRAWWSGMWADRTVSSKYADGAVKSGHATKEDLESAAQMWRRWGECEDGWFAMLHGEVICRV